MQDVIGELIRLLYPKSEDGKTIKYVKKIAEGFTILLSDNIKKNKHNNKQSQIIIQSYKRST